MGLLWPAIWLCSCGRSDKCPRLPLDPPWLVVMIVHPAVSQMCLTTRSIWVKSYIEWAGETPTTFFILPFSNLKLINSIAQRRKMEVVGGCAIAVVAMKRDQASGSVGDLGECALLTSSTGFS